MISFNQHKNKRFKYKPRFDKNEVKNDTATEADDLVSKLRKSKGLLRGTKSKGISISVLIVILIGIIIVMYYLENKY